MIRVVPICTCMRAQVHLTLCDTMDCSPPGSSVHGISQARILEWVAISFSWGSSWYRDRTWVSSVHGISQARILEWVAISFSWGSSWYRDRTWVSSVSHVGRWILYLGSPVLFLHIHHHPLRGVSSPLLQSFWSSRHFQVLLADPIF